LLRADLGETRPRLSQPGRMRRFRVGTLNGYICYYFFLVKSAEYSTSDSTKIISFQLPHPIESRHCGRKSHMTIRTKVTLVKVGLTWDSQRWLGKGVRKNFILTDVAKVLACNFDTLRERLFTFTDPDTRVIKLIPQSAVLSST